MNEVKNKAIVHCEMLPIEKEASEFVNRIGLDRAYRLLDKLTRRFDRRYARVCKASFAPINREWVRSTRFELDLTYRLKLGIQINDDYFTPHAAQKRIIARRLAQKEARKTGRE